MTQPNGPRTRFLVRALTALSENTYMSAIRAGMVSIVPLTIIGGLFMIVAEFPSESWKAIVQPYRPLLQVPVTATYGLLSVFVCFAIAYDLGKRLKQEADAVGYRGQFVFNTARPDGMPRKLMDVGRLTALGWTAKTPFREGIARAYDWFVRNAAEAA